MTLQAVARRYAAALFDVVQKTGEIDRTERDLSAVRALVDGHTDLHRVWESSGVPPAKKRALVDALLAGGLDVSPAVARLLQMMADRDRLMVWSALVDAFNDRVKRARNIVTGEVVSAVPLGETRLNALADALGKASGGRVTLSEQVDPSIIGGVVARIGGVVFDGSVTRQIDRMRSRLLGGA